MSHNLYKAKVGYKITYWHSKSKKFQKGEVIGKTKTDITIKIWTSILNPKIITIDYPSDWRYQIAQNCIRYRAQNSIFPSWIKTSALCIIYDTNTKCEIIAKIAKYGDGKSITLFYIEYSDDIKKLKTITINVCNNKKQIITQKSLYIYFIHNNKEQILYAFSNHIEIESHYDELNDIQNNKLIKILSQNKRKSTKQQITMIYHKKCNDTICDYITSSKLQYGIILESNTFPFDVNRLIISFLAQQMVYICPPTPIQCDEAQSWQFSEELCGNIYELSVIGVEFVMNRDLIISGFELNNIEMLGRYKHKIYLNKYIETKQLQLFEELRNAQFVFNGNKLMTLKEGDKYTVEIKVNANVPCYQCHEAPSKVKGLNETIYDWKCFKYIKWKKFNHPALFKHKSCELQWFPHFAFLLP